jgi:hypothetical protein
MLASIQQDRPLQTRPGEPTEDEMKLKIYSAICTLAVTEHEVVALVANAEALQLDLLFTKSSEYDESSPSSTQPTVQWDILVTQNPRQDMQRTEKDSKDSWIIPEVPDCLKAFQLDLKRFKNDDYVEQFRNHLNAGSR